jgi:hypothetical protein
MTGFEGINNFDFMLGAEHTLTTTIFLDVFVKITVSKDQAPCNPKQCHDWTKNIILSFLLCALHQG